ncbi:DUF5658 family protein [Sporosarcina sp. ACRSL]|uniref:DUF5658 family protein n=1 Tax=Sporosarcina sp. ACRSL TaxID=2918215 RepID=UPI001EF739FA|nr:DUF5658 family protein [Sporosarcina sp. ACRSL]MCG7346074.1 DUF5658 family protein [Sporosarcina sp. ACRSL]
METTKALPSSKDRLLHTCFLLFCLCMIDAIFTDFGIRYGHIQEANIFVRFLYESNVVAFYLMKASLPILLFIVMHFLKPSQLVRNLLAVTLCIYTLVILIHISWIIIVSTFI